MFDRYSPIVKGCWRREFTLMKSHDSVPGKFKTCSKFAIKSKKCGFNRSNLNCRISLYLVKAQSVFFDRSIAVAPHIGQNLPHNVGNVGTGIDGLWQHVFKRATLLREIKSTEHLSNPTWPHLASRWPLWLISAIMESWLIAQSSRR